MREESVSLTFAASQFSKEKGYWLKKLSGSPENTVFLHDYGCREKSANREFVKFGFPYELNKKLIHLSKGNDFALHMILMAGLIMLLHNYTGKTDIIVGTPIYRQDHDDNVYEFMNTVLALRSFIDGSATFKEVLLQVKQTVLEAEEHQNYPIEKLLTHLDVPFSGEFFPLFDTALLLENIHEKKYFYSVNIRTVYSFVKLSDCIEGVIEYHPASSEKSLVERMISHYKNLMNRVVFSVNLPLSKVCILSEEEKRHILFDFNNTRTDYPSGKTIHGLFEEQAGKLPDRRAAICGNSELTFWELNQKATQLAGILKEKGMQEGNMVCIMVDRSLAMIIAIMGILKAGSAYLPINPESPVRTREYILKDSNTALLLTTRSLFAEIEGLGNLGIEAFFLEEQAGRNREPSGIGRKPGTRLPGENTEYSARGGRARRTASFDPCYVIYTSGSSGKPKGVIVEHHSLVNRLSWMQRFYPIGKADVILQKTPYIFDVSAWELFWWSFAGASLSFLPPRSEKDPEAIVEAIEKQKITTLHFVPSMLKVFLDFLEGSGKRYRFTALSRVFSSGETLETVHVKAFYRWLGGRGGPLLVNLYGPTEATVDVSYHNCCPEVMPDRVPIGKPIDNIRLYIVDKNVHILPPGIIGELVIAGEGLARGYLNKPELSKEKFIENPYSHPPAPGAVSEGQSHRGEPCIPPAMLPNSQLSNSHSPRLSTNELSTFQLLYKTGDLARWLPDGVIEFFGRSDNRVKIRGIMIDPGEIENSLLNYPGIKAVVVAVKEDGAGDKYLCAYYASNGDISVEEWREYLLKDLPEYMIPNLFVRVDEIPLTANGKVDRKALPEPRILRGLQYESPRNPLEEKLVGIWEEVLGAEKDTVGIHDNFFALGGHSIKVVKVVELANRENISISYIDIFRCQTIAELADNIVSGTTGGHKLTRGNESVLMDIGTFNPGFFPDNYPEYFPCILAIVREKLRYEQSYDIAKGLFLTIDGSALMGLGYECGCSLEEKQNYMNFPYGYLCGFQGIEKVLGYSLNSIIFPSFEEQIAFCIKQLEQKKVVILTGTTYFLNYTPDYLLDKEQWLRKMDGFFPPAYKPAKHKDYGEMPGHIFMLTDITADGYIICDSTYNFFGRVPREDLRKAVKGNSAIECSRGHMSYNAYRSFGILDLDVTKLNRFAARDLELHILEKIITSYQTKRKLKLKNMGRKYVAFLGLTAIRELMRIIKIEKKNKENSGFLFRYISHFINAWNNKLLYLEIFLQDFAKNFEMPADLLPGLTGIIKNWEYLNDDFRDIDSPEGRWEPLFSRSLTRLKGMYRELDVFFKKLHEAFVKVKGNLGG